jgi:predicted transcriptional regulator
MLETNTNRSTKERLVVVEEKVSKLDKIEDKVTDIQVNVAEIRLQLNSVVDHIERHTKIDGQRLTTLENFVTSEQARKEHTVKIWSRLAMIVAMLGTVASIIAAIKGR